MKKFFFNKVLLCFWAFFAVTSVSAKDFQPGDTIMVAYPAFNIKDDAYIIGLVRQQLQNGDYQISVLDYVKGHDYGLSCVPIRENELGEATNEVVWELWSDTTQLYGKGMQYQVPKANVRKLQIGQFDFIERNNLYITFSRWKSNAPIMVLEQFDMAIETAKSLGLVEMVPALALAKKERAAYYETEIGRPYWAYESVPKLNELLVEVIAILKADDELNRLWRGKTRDWKPKTISTKHYFLIEALDKIKFDASYEAVKDGVEKVDPAVLHQFKERLKFLGSKI